MAHSKFIQGVYNPINAAKFMGRQALYRSSFELKFFKWADLNPKVLKWGSENIVVPYLSPVDGRLHRYFVDNIIHLREGANIVRYLIEIKPSKQTIAPTPSKRKKASTVLYEQVTYAVNTAKWEAATDYAKKHGMKFQILTERELFT